MYERCTDVEMDPTEVSGRHDPSAHHSTQITLLNRILTLTRTLIEKAWQGLARCCELRREAFAPIAIPVTRAHSALHTISLEVRNSNPKLSLSINIPPFNCRRVSLRWLQKRQRGSFRPILRCPFSLCIESYSNPNPKRFLEVYGARHPLTGIQHYTQGSPQTMHLALDSVTNVSLEFHSDL